MNGELLTYLMLLLNMLQIVKKIQKCKIFSFYNFYFLRIIERVAPRLSHTNAGVVLSATKVIMKFLDYLNNPDLIKTMSRKLTQPLITLLSCETEI